MHRGKALLVMDFSPATSAVCPFCALGMPWYNASVKMSKACRTLFGVPHRPHNFCRPHSFTWCLQSCLSHSCLNPFPNLCCSVKCYHRVATSVASGLRFGQQGPALEKAGADFAWQWGSYLFHLLQVKPTGPPCTKTLPNKPNTLVLRKQTQPPM